MLQKVFILMVWMTAGFCTIHAQPSFLDQQKNSPRVTGIFNKLEDTIRQQFDAKKLAWPPAAVYIRTFKYDKQLELWVKGSQPQEPFRLFKTYKVCMQSGAMGPKRMQGDFQVPEGFYHINEFNPNSNYHLSMGLNYPNASDRILSDPARPGNAIYVHGNCVSTGCIAITNSPMEELYFIASHAREVGQEFIPIHVFPIRYQDPKSRAFLENLHSGRSDLRQFHESLLPVYDYFEKTKQLPIILVNREGRYIMQERSL